MKNIYKKALYILFAAITITSCEDEDKSPLFVDSDPSNDATFVVITKQTSVIDFTDSSTSYDFTISAPKNNVESISINVKAAGSDLDPVPIASSNSIPAEFKFTADDIVTALGASITDFGPGDRFDFSSTAKGTDGTTATFNDLSAPSQGPGQFQGFNHVTYLSCPFSASEAIGTYAITANSFSNIPNAGAGTTFEIIAGPDDSTVTVVGLYEKNFNIEVDTKTGIATIPRQPIVSNISGYAGGSINTSSTSFFFSCAGSIAFRVQYVVDLGSFGSGYVFEAQKQ